MTGEPKAIVKGVFAAAAFAAALVAAGPVLAGPESLRQGLFGRAPDGRQFAAPPIARYVSEDGEGFILDRTAPRPLLKFDDSPEVWVLQAQPGPRGDVIYKNELGQPVLRATRLGGVTVFTDERPSGSAAAVAGGGPPLRFTPMGPQEFSDRMMQATARASRAARHGVTFQVQIDGATPATLPLVADAATVASVAMVRMAARPEGRSLLARLKRVLLTQGRRSSAVFQQETLLITVVLDQGPAGRPSSDRIMAVANRH